MVSGAAEVAMERALQELAIAADLNEILAGSVRSGVAGADLSPEVGEWGALDLSALTDGLQRETAAANEWGADGQVWRLFGYAPLDVLLDAAGPGASGAVEAAEAQEAEGRGWREWRRRRYALYGRLGSPMIRQTAMATHRPTPTAGDGAGRRPSDRSGAARRSPPRSGGMAGACELISWREAVAG